MQLRLDKELCAKILRHEIFMQVLLFIPNDAKTKYQILGVGRRAQKSSTKLSAFCCCLQLKKLSQIHAQNWLLK